MRAKQTMAKWKQPMQQQTLQGISGQKTLQSYMICTCATCKTKNLIQCRQCSKWYVAETENTLHICLNGHRSDIRTNKIEKPVLEHFNLPGQTSLLWSLRRYGKMFNWEREQRATGSITSDLWPRGHESGLQCVRTYTSCWHNCLQMSSVRTP